MTVRELLESLMDMPEESLDKPVVIQTESPATITFFGKIKDVYWLEQSQFASDKIHGIINERQYNSMGPLKDLYKEVIPSDTVVIYSNHEEGENTIITPEGNKIDEVILRQGQEYLTDNEPPFANYEAKQIYLEPADMVKEIEGDDTYQPITVNMTAEMVEYFQDLLIGYKDDNIQYFQDEEFWKLDEAFNLIRPGIIPAGH